MPAESTISIVLNRITHPELLYLRKVLRGQELHDFNKLWLKKKSGKPENLGNEAKKTEAAKLARLGRHVSEILGEYRKQGQPKGIIDRMRMEADVLYEAGKTSMALKSLKKAFEIAVEAEEFGIASEIYEDLQVMSEEKGMKMPVSTEAIDACHTELKSLWDLNGIVKEIKAIKQGRDSGREAYATAFVSRLEALPHHQSVKGKLHWHWCMIFCFTILRRSLEMHRHADAVLSTVKKRPKVLINKQCREMYTTCAVAGCGALADMRRYEEALALLRDAGDLIASQGFSPEERLDLWSHRIHILVAYEQKDSEKVDRLAHKAFESLFTWFAVSADRKARFCVDVASRLVSFGNPSVFKWVAITNSLRNEISNPLLLVANSFIELAALTMKGENELLINRCESIKYLLKSRKINTTSFKLVVRTFERIGSGKTTAHVGLLYLKNSLANNESEYQFARVMERFNLVGWIDHALSK